MNRTIYIVFVAITFLQTAQAQGAFRLGPVGEIIIGPNEDWAHAGASLTVEAGFKKHFAVCGTALLSSSPARSDVYKRRLLEFRPEARYYIREALNGLFVGAYLMLAFEDWQDTRLPNTPYIQEGVYVGPGISLGAVTKISTHLDCSFQINGAVHLDGKAIPVGGAFQLGYRF